MSNSYLPDPNEFHVDEPLHAAPIFRGDVYDHPKYCAVIVTRIEPLPLTMRQRVFYRPATMDELRDNGYI